MFYIRLTICRVIFNVAKVLLAEIAARYILLVSFTQRVNSPPGLTTPGSDSMPVPAISQECPSDRQ